MKVHIGYALAVNDFKLLQKTSQKHIRHADQNLENLKTVCFTNGKENEYMPDIVNFSFIKRRSNR